MSFVERSAFVNIFGGGNLGGVRDKHRSAGLDLRERADGFGGEGYLLEMPV